MMIESAKIIFHIIMGIYVPENVKILILVISIEILWIFYLVSKTLKMGLTIVGNVSFLCCL